MKRSAILLLILLLSSLALCSCEQAVTVEYRADGGGIIAGNMLQTVKTVDGVATFESVTAQPLEGYRFIGWDDGQTQPTRRDSLSEDRIFTARFEKLPPLYLEYRAEIGGRLDGTPFYTGEYGEALTGEITAVAEDGYRFVGWSDGVENATRADTVTESTVLVAQFKKLHTVTFITEGEGGTLAGWTDQTVLDGEKTRSVYASAAVGYRFAGWSTGESKNSLIFTPTEDTVVVARFERADLSMPVIELYTADGASIVSREEYLTCTVNVANTEDRFTLTGATAQIRGRGNSSWDNPKKSYRLKFDKATDLFGFGAARDWTLIANYVDLSLMRNYLAYSVAARFDTLKATTSTQYVEVYLNGEYIGVYLLCEQIEAKKNRVNIKESTWVDTGYLIEMDGRGDGTGFHANFKYYAIKTPDPELSTFTKEHTKFIKEYLENCFDTLDAGDYAAVKELMDVRSFAQAYIVYELFNCVDVGYASFYLHKDQGGPLRCGPVWDFDRSLGVIGNTKGAKEYDALWAKEANPWFKALLEYEEFRLLVAEELAAHKDAILQAMSDCYAYADAHKDAFARNFKRWNILGTNVWPNPNDILALKTWDKQVEYTEDYLTKSLNYLLTVYPLE